MKIQNTLLMNNKTKGGNMSKSNSNNSVILYLLLFFIAVIASIGGIVLISEEEKETASIFEQNMNNDIDFRNKVFLLEAKKICEDSNDRIFVHTLLKRNRLGQYNGWFNYEIKNTEKEGKSFFVSARKLPVEEACPEKSKKFIQLKMKDRETTNYQIQETSFSYEHEIYPSNIIEKISLPVKFEYNTQFELFHYNVNVKIKNEEKFGYYFNTLDEANAFVSKLRKTL